MSMRLSFGPDDEDEFFATRDRLLGELGEWVDTHRPADVDHVTDAQIFLDWRWGYSTGELDRYQDGDIAEYLLEWCPRKVTAPPEMAYGLCLGIEVLVEFLAATDRLQGGHRRADRLVSIVHELKDDTQQAMGDSSKFGMGKSVLDAIGLDDLPESIEDAQAFLQEKMDEFNALPFEERKAITDPGMMSQPEAFVLPFTHVPPAPEEVEASARSVPILARFEALRQFLGDKGRPLTQRDNIKLADARELVDLLETGETFDLEIGSRVTSRELPRLSMFVDWAEKARAVRKVKGRLLPVKAWATKPVVERTERTYRALIELGPLWAQSGGWWWRDQLAMFLDDGVPHWLSMLLAPGAEIALDELVAMTVDLLSEQFQPLPSYLSEPDRDDDVAKDMASLFETLELAGVVEWEGWEVVTGRFGRERRHGGFIRLTPVGRHLAPPYVEEAGYRIETVPDLSEVTGAELVRSIIELDLDPPAILQGWWPDRPSAERTAEVAAVFRDASSAEDRLVALTLLGEFDPADVEPLLRGLLETPVGAHAALFLMGEGLGSEDELGAYFGVGPVVDALSVQIDTPEELGDIFADAPVEDSLGLLDEMWRHDQPETLPVLEALGKHLPDPRLAKAARKAVMRHRSFLANRSHSN